MVVLLMMTVRQLRLVEAEDGVLVQDDEAISSEYVFDADEVDNYEVLRSRNHLMARFVLCCEQHLQGQVVDGPSRHPKAKLSRSSN